MTGRERDGSLGLADRKGAARAIAIDLDRGAGGRSPGGLTWVPLPEWAAARPSSSGCCDDPPGPGRALVGRRLRRTPAHGPGRPPTAPAWWATGSTSGSDRGWPPRPAGRRGRRRRVRDRSPGHRRPPDDELVVRATRARTLADTVAPGMRLLVVGLNPSLYSADAGHRLRPAGQPVLAGRAGRRAGQPRPRSRLTPWRHHGLGMTDLVKRATPRADELSPDEYRAGVARLERLAGWLAPARHLLRRAWPGGGPRWTAGRGPASSPTELGGVPRLRDALDQRGQRPRSLAAADRPPGRGGRSWPTRSHPRWRPSERIRQADGGDGG